VTRHFENVDEFIKEINKLGEEQESESL